MTARSVGLASASREFGIFLRPSKPLALDALIAAAPRGDGHAVLVLPGSFLFSRDDGLLEWTHCCDPAPDVENIEISGPQVLIAQNPQVLAIVAQVLARPEA